MHPSTVHTAIRGCALALALAAPAAAQAGPRPTARVEFTFPSKSYEAAGVEAARLARGIEERLFRVTILSAPDEGARPHFALKVGLTDLASDETSPHLRSMYLSFELTGTFGERSPQPGAGFYWMFRDPAHFNDALDDLESELLGRIDDLCGQPQAVTALVEGLLWYVPLASYDVGTPVECKYRLGGESEPTKLELPFRAADVGLDPRSVFLVDVIKDATSDDLELKSHLVRGEVVLKLQKMRAVDWERSREASAIPASARVGQPFEAPQEQLVPLRELALHQAQQNSVQLYRIYVLSGRPTGDVTDATSPTNVQ